jgi:hypothetical protein
MRWKDSNAWIGCYCARNSESCLIPSESFIASVLRFSSPVFIFILLFRGQIHFTRLTEFSSCSLLPLDLIDLATAARLRALKHFNKNSLPNNSKKNVKKSFIDRMIIIEGIIR